MAAGFLWAFAGTGSQIISRIIGIGILSRYVGPLETGFWAIVTLSYTPIIDLVGRGVSPTLIRRRRFRKSHLRRLLGALIILGLIVAFSLASASHLLASYFPDNFSPAWLAIGGCVAFFELVHIVLKAQMTREFRFKQIALIQLLGTLIGFWMTTIPLAYFGWGVWSLALGVLLQKTLVAACSWLLRPLQPRFDFRPLMPFAREAAAFAAVGMVNSWARSIDNYFAAFFLGTSNLGVYTKSYALSSLPNNLISQTGQSVILPALAQHNVDRRTEAKHFQDLLQTYILVMAPIATLTGVFAKDIVDLYIGDMWKEVAPVLQVLSLTLLIRPLTNVSLTMLKSAGQVRELLHLQIANLLSIAIGCLLLLRFGLIGIAWGVNLGAVITFMLATCIELRRLNMHWVTLGRVVLPNIAVLTALSVLMVYLQIMTTSHGLSAFQSIASALPIYFLAYGLLLVGFSRKLIPAPLIRAIQTSRLLGGAA